MNRPVIGITADLLRREDGVHIGEIRQYLNGCYIKSVLKAGGMPLILPVADDTEIIEKYLDVVDGLLLSGGGDVNPLLFGEEPHPMLGGVNADRDAMEIALAKRAFLQKMPLLAICRGIQVLNIAFGGTLYQHLPPDEFSVQHAQKTAGDFASHTVLIKNGSTLAAICGEKTVTNSFHHQAVKDVAEGFTAVAASKDGVIEAIERSGGEPFTVGVQWHPELMTEKHPAMFNLFREFVNAAGENARWKKQTPPERL